MQRSSLNSPCLFYLFFFNSHSGKVKETHFLQASLQTYIHAGMPLPAAAPLALISFNHLTSACTAWPRIARAQPEIGWGPS